MDPKEEIKSRVDIAELVGEYLPLKPAGPSRFRALCPFHAEKTPSFHVSADKQIWHCFGCNEGGDCFSFVMKMEGMDFPEALMHLGKKVGVEVVRFSATETNEKRRLLEANDLAARYYRKVLMESAVGVNARAYLERRGIPDTLAETFGLGFAPDAWDALTVFLSKRGFQPVEQEKAGLVLRRKDGSGVYDRFRNRLMIPLCDAHGNVIGFTGRVMPQEGSQASEDGPKYMNSPETEIYHKGRTLYGLHLAKQAIKREGRVVIVEGNLDVVASHKAGVENVVGSSGTALTEDQLAILRRFTTTIVFSFDADAAGFKAAQRGIALARRSGFDVRVAVLPADAGKDPDEAVQNDPELWRVACAKTVPIMQYFIDRAAVGRDLSSVDDKRAVAALLIPELSQIKDVIEREHWLQTVSDLLRTNTDVLRDAINGTQMSGSVRPERAGVGTARVPASRAASPTTRDEQAVRSLLGMLVQVPSVREMIVLALEARLLPSDRVWALYNDMREEYHSSQSMDQAPHSYFGRLEARLTGRDHERSLLHEIVLHGEEIVAQLPPERVADQVHELLDSLTASDHDRRRKAIEADMRRAEQAGDKATVEKLIREFNALR
ncbi:DNA primase [Candidatus Uhrbacteria bacterium RIFOXYB12_FULL_58_10]|uniref:DNA primase n=1 Tax=Candidatus Uhrbacteria bacterium RIFOXYB2_FULL_57_15 TaxID=1802422 RepID=A0A1F7W9J6_9BACT|nr:MAG: DNA primase [Candidatus Uhrbacteria bacterium RIFOXYB12_FULL_58_10]OGL98754.1 MAG: DNA primase [Candidatus Uhrbacteria bacterium RIFOXYB2_FULL_57_15]OGL99959.1 MAG: DNA primase [Candidatus Uhrbacteria bacterium RIFOXYC12_FULL_57_11]